MKTKFVYNINSKGQTFNIKSIHAKQSGPDLAMWGPRAPSDEGALKVQNKMRDL